MSSTSRKSYINRRIDSIQSVRSNSNRRSRAASLAARPAPVSHDDAYSYALRVAYLHYLIQPKTKRKQWVPAPKPPPRTHTSNISDLVKEFVPGNSTSVKLPHSFHTPLLKRMEGVIRGSEALPGYSDAAVKKTFAQAYTAFTEASFKKSIDKERKVEPLVLIFYSAATKACSLGHTPGDDSWKLLVDRHLALFVRLITHTLRAQNERDKPELMSRLSTLENKLLTNDQNLYIDTSQDAGKHIEVIVPLSYDVKDMPMVQAVAKIFGLSHSDVQSHIDTQRPNWTEETALRDLKAYQHRLNANMSGVLQSQDFEVEEAYQDWKKAETHFLTSMMMEILTAKPELAKTSSGGNAAAEKSLPTSPGAGHGEEQSYANISQVSSSSKRTSFYGIEKNRISLSSMTLEDTSSIRAVDEASYTFIPSDPREFLKVISNYALEFDAMHGNGDEQNGPFSKQSIELLTELCVRWRVPQFTRLVVYIEVAARRFTDTLFTVIDLDSAFDLVKSPPPEKELKKPPHIYLYSESLATIDRDRWTLTDSSTYQQTLYTLHDALLRELYDILMHCYQPKPPSAGPSVHVLQNHIFCDSSFSRKEEEAMEYTKMLQDGMVEQAASAYRGFLDAEIPPDQQDWNFSHVKNLGNSVVKLCEKIQKRYRSNPVIMGVNPLTVLAETIFPSFENDAHELVKRIMQVARDRGDELPLQDGFDLYKELVEIRRIHRSSLPNQPFTFDVEELLVEFVWRWIHNAEERAEAFVDEAIKHDQFQVRGQGEQAARDADRHSHSVIDMFQLFHQTADQVFQLEWNNDIHHARFMTALSKIFANSIARYCEIVDQRFVKEMDTLRSNEQEAAASGQTTQRFMQYAKDAWNNKEKMEPFQFYPESLVKLNNIEWAMQELDKLERTMNVDACAAILEKVDGPKRQVRRPAKYVFTIKIVEAEEIKACDPNGTSDPYVVLVDEYQKRLHKTRIIMRTLSPRWDESVDVTVSGALNIVATIWDYDTFGDHDFVGRTSLKLDPLHFSDYLPREFWLDLDTQGRILLRVSMEGERDDIQFYFGKAFRHLKRTERDMVRKITDKLSRQINASLSYEALRSLLGRNLASQVNSFFKRSSTLPTLTDADVENALQSLFAYFNDNFSTMKETLTDATMVAVMTRLWKEVLMAIEALVVPPLSEKPSSQRPLNQRELDVVFKWLKLLYSFFNAQDETGEVLGVPAEVLRSPKYHELNSLNFFYFDSTENLIRTSERMAAATAQRQQQQLQGQMASSNRLSAPPTFGGAAAGPAFASMGTIRRGKSIMMSRNLGTMRRAKEEKRKEAQADPSDDMILRILRMRPEATGYLKERHRQKERMAAAAAAAMIVKQSVSQGWNSAAQVLAEVVYRALISHLSKLHKW